MCFPPSYFVVQFRNFLCASVVLLYIVGILWVILFLASLVVQWGFYFQMIVAQILVCKQYYMCLNYKTPEHLPKLTHLTLVQLFHFVFLFFSCIKLICMTFMMDVRCQSLP
ncbi:hypothetical protein DUNSADRAFT_10219 [Dunaliella salina]|uniref:Uncharacterized protein n=1 Tax=Dunaliella salina TaxID=3046 RepID=A0ABQ7GFU1_DUNSA|nr:hypothetical protein DUNSADRAFT_10219 [Dunaliella salina]|eukprot:KAF5833464.1 hypothetical protein DUNSADRAFT_10219 [Dunaliella salina]